MLLSVADVAKKLNLPVDDVRKVVRETGIGQSIHKDGHWQRRIKEEEFVVILAHLESK